MIQIEEVLKQELAKAENFFRTSCKSERVSSITLSDKGKRSYENYDRIRI